MALETTSSGAALSGIPLVRRSNDISYHVENTLRTIFKRCVSCPDEQPTCPTCGKNEICSLVPADCNACASMICVRNPSPPPSSSGPNVGAIAGGVVGGIAFVAIIVFLLWRFHIKKKRAQQELEAEEWEEDDIAQQKSNQNFRAMHQDAASTRTRGSLANSILSRASNYIHIAYIPGVTNRNGNDSSHNSMTPVPPIPAARRDMPRSPLTNDDGAIFFRPNDLRDSTYSGTSDFTDRRDTQYTRASITPSLARSSIASGIYTNNVDPMPAQQVVRAAPRMVSVKSSGHSSSNTPGSTSTDHENSEFAANTPAAKGKPVQVMMPGEKSQRSANNSVKSNASYGKAQQITVASNKGKNGNSSRPVSRDGSQSSKHAPSVSSPLAETEPEETLTLPKTHFSPTVLTPINASPASQPAESPFFDASESVPTPSSPAHPRPNPYASMTSSVVRSREDRPRRRSRGPGGLSAVIEEATKRASQMTAPGSRDGQRESSPFTDAHRFE